MSRTTSPALVVIGGACLLGLSSPSHAAFQLVNEFNLGVTEIHGLTTDGNQWFVGHTFTNRFYNFDLNWNLLGETTVTGAAINDLRAITYDSSSGTLFVADAFPAIVYEVTLGGSVLSSFHSGAPNSFLNNMSYNLIDDTLWTGHFNGGLIQHFDTAGNLLGSFADPTKLWTGLAVDPVAQTLLALDTNDTLHEYDFSGNLITNHAIPAIQDNGQGLYYDPFTATLYVTSQDGTLLILNDPSRPVIPAPGVLALLGCAGLICSRRRR